MEADTTSTVLISACLLGYKVRYDGTSKANEFVISLADKIKYEPVCPEMAGGLSCPRPVSEIKGTRVISEQGKDVSEFFIAGAKDVCKTAQDCNSKLAILKAKSPSCSSSKIYDGTFSNTLIDGMGISAQALRAQGVLVVDENQLLELHITKEHPLALFVFKDCKDLTADISENEVLVHPFIYTDDTNLINTIKLAQRMGCRLGLICNRNATYIPALLANLLSVNQDISHELADVLKEAKSSTSSKLKYLDCKGMKLLEISQQLSTVTTINAILNIVIKLFK